MIRLDADVGPMKLAFHQTPKVLHCIGVNGAPRVLHG
jgi:hypothetical protein